MPRQLVHPGRRSALSDPIHELKRKGQQDADRNMKNRRTHPAMTGHGHGTGMAMERRRRAAPIFPWCCAAVEATRPGDAVVEILTVSCRGRDRPVCVLLPLGRRCAATDVAMRVGLLPVTRSIGGGACVGWNVVSSDAAFLWPDRQPADTECHWNPGRRRVNGKGARGRRRMPDPARVSSR